MTPPLNLATFVRSFRPSVLAFFHHQLSADDESFRRALGRRWPAARCALSPPQKSARTQSSRPCTNVVNQGGIQTILTATTWELEPTAVAASFGDAACSTPSQRVHKEAHVARFNTVETEALSPRTGEARSAGRKSICQSSRAARESRREVLGERTL